MYIHIFGIHMYIYVHIHMMCILYIYTYHYVIIRLRTPLCRCVRHGGSCPRTFQILPRWTDGLLAEGGICQDLKDCLGLRVPISKRFDSRLRALTIVSVQDLPLETQH